MTRATCRCGADFAPRRTRGHGPALCAACEIKWWRRKRDFRAAVAAALPGVAIPEYASAAAVAAGVRAWIDDGDEPGLTIRADGWAVRGADPSAVVAEAIALVADRLAALRRAAAAPEPQREETDHATP